MVQNLMSSFDKSLDKTRFSHENILWEEILNLDEKLFFDGRKKNIETKSLQNFLPRAINREKKLKQKCEIKNIEPRRTFIEE